MTEILECVVIVTNELLFVDFRELARIETIVIHWDLAREWFQINCYQHYNIDQNFLGTHELLCNLL